MSYWAGCGGGSGVVVGVAWGGGGDLSGGGVDGRGGIGWWVWKWGR